MGHFTYEEEPRADLSQGDVICRTPDVEKILKEVHPHYFHSGDYKYFIVLTQTCDLVRRNGAPPSSRYVSIAAVRPMELAVQRKAEGLLNSAIDRKYGICDDARKAKLEQFIEKLFNNNEADYFYLHRDPARGMVEDQCAFLKLSVALKAELHYETLLNARVIQLQESFQHKLGYLIGNSYMRIGTDDWLPNNIEQKEWRSKIREAVNSVQSINFFPKEAYSYIVKKVQDTPTEFLTEDALAALVKEKAGEKGRRKAALVKLIEGALDEAGVEPARAKRVRNLLASDPRLTPLVS